MAEARTPTWMHIVSFVVGIAVAVIVACSEPLQPSPWECAHPQTYLEGGLTTPTQRVAFTWCDPPVHASVNLQTGVMTWTRDSLPPEWFHTHAQPDGTHVIP